MPSLLFRHQQNAASTNNRRTLLAILLLLTSVVAYIGTSAKHSLLTGATSWLLLWVYASVKTASARRLSGLAQTSAWSAGGLLALGQICARAVEGRGVWWANVRYFYCVVVWVGKSGVSD